MNRIANLPRMIRGRVVRSLINRYGDRVKSFAHGVETRLERAWEWKRRYFQAMPSDGEMTAFLRRNGWTGFYPYLLKQKRGDFGRRNFTPGDRDALSNRLRTQFPQEVARIIAQAEKVVSGEFDLLGSGPVDMRRSRSGPGYRIDWNRDPISGERYPTIFSHWRWNPFKMRRGNADVKGPWELTRCQHFPLLGQAYWLTGDERYTECYARTIEDFIRCNRPGIGVHWACPMDVALRTVSWLIGLSYFQGAPALGSLWWRRFLKSLVQHGRHITNNLEFGTLEGRVIVSNHGLANLFGLYWLGLNFSGLDAGCVWRGIAETGLEQQIRLQLLDDGGGFESSIPYHRLVTEIFLSAYALAQHHGFSFSDEYRRRLLNALRFIKALRQDGGRQPQIGDADNGRAHILSGYGVWEEEQENMDHLLVAGAVVLGCPDLAEGIDPRFQLEALFWRDLGDPESKPTPLSAVEPGVLFDDAGIAVLRRKDAYALMSNSVCGTFGIGNHKHNDQLAIEWVLGDQPLLVDAGSYTYTQDPAARNWFRSTRQHNTLQIDDQEQNGLDSSALFRLVQQGGPIWECPWQDADGRWGVRARNTAYSRLSGAPNHIRGIIMSSDGQLVIDDQIENADGHELRWCFIVHPSVSVELSGNIATLTGRRSAVIEAPDWANWVVEPAWYSRGYGVRQQTKALVMTATSIQRVVFVARQKIEPNPLRSTAALQLADAFWQKYSAS